MRKKKSTLENECCCVCGCHICNDTTYSYFLKTINFINCRGYLDQQQDIFLVYLEYFVTGFEVKIRRMNVCFSVF